MHRSRFGWLFGTLGLALTGCAVTSQSPDEPVPAAVVAAVVSVPEAEEAAPPEIETYVPPDPTQVVGMVQTDLRRLMGEPSLVRTEATAEVWQYRSAGCVMDLFLYRNGRGSGREVVYFEVRDVREGQRLSETAARYCFGHIIQA